jgi:hypothetical protein
MAMPNLKISGSALFFFFLPKSPKRSNEKGKEKGLTSISKLYCLVL